MYDSLQFPVEINTRGSKTDNFYSFSHEVWLRGTVLIIFSQLLAEYNFNILHDLKTDTFERCRHIYSFIYMSLLTQ